MGIRTFLVLLYLSISILGLSAQEDLYNQSLEFLRQARSIEGDFQKQIELADKASAGFESLGIDSLYLDSELVLARAGYMIKDSALLFGHLTPIFDFARMSKDTGILVSAYNLLGFYYFSKGNSTDGINALKQPHRFNYYSNDALESSITNLGALIDIGLTYTMNLDSVYEYSNQLQYLAQRYDDPSVQVVSRFKKAQLFSKADNYSEVVNVLRGATPYLSRVENKGFLHFFYESLISAFIKLNQPDSASHYIKVLQEVASYAKEDPRNCYILVSKVQADIQLGNQAALPEGFELCFDRAKSEVEKSQRVNNANLNILYSKCLFLNYKKSWKEFDPLINLLIVSATGSKNKNMLRDAYEIQYQSYRERGMTSKALEAHVEYSKYVNETNQFVFSQSAALIRNQMNLKLAEQENSMLQIENQNQQLRIDRVNTLRKLYISGFLILGLIVAYLVNLAQSRANRTKELSAVVDQRTEELKESNDALILTNQKLSKSNSELANFAYVASHDLKTPLHNIIKFSSLISERLKNMEVEGINDYLSIIMNSGKRMDVMISDVLDYSLLSQNRNDQDNGSVDLNNLFNEISSSIATFIDQKNTKIDIPKPLSTISTKRSNMFVLFKNLIENGIRYNQSDKPTIKIYEEEHPEYYVICVKDNGIGIKDEYHEKVFGMFTRLHSQNQYEGSGIGLASCKKIVEELGGKIDIESKIDEYSIFKISLPKSLIA